jgi:hypothetical protein
MSEDAFRFRAAAWLFVLATIGYALIGGYLLYVTGPGPSGWHVHWEMSPPVLVPLAASFCCVLLLFTLSAARTARAIAAVACAALLLSGWALMALPILGPVAVLAIRIQQVRIARAPMA